MKTIEVFKKIYKAIYNYLQVAFVIFLTLFILCTIFMEIDTQEFRDSIKGCLGIGLVFSFFYNISK